MVANWYQIAMGVNPGEMGGGGGMRPPVILVWETNI